MPPAVSPAARVREREVKEAALRKAASENDGQDQAFERAMADVARLIFKDRAPRLLDHEVGFRLIDRDSEANKAVGAAVFQVGETVLLVPVFFIDGKVKGTEIIYIKKPRQAVPLQSAWVDHLIAKGGEGLGVPSRPEDDQVAAAAPDLWRLSRPPMKLASAPVSGRDRAWAEIVEALPGWARAVTSPCFSPAPAWGLESFVKAAGAPAIKALAACFRELPFLADELERRRGAGVWERLRRAAEEAPPPSLASKMASGAPASMPFAPVTLDYDLDAPSLFRAAPDPPNAPGDRFNVAAQSAAERVPTPRLVQTGRAMTNPSATGLYDVMTRPTVYERCFVAVNAWTARQTLQSCVVVRLSDGHYWNLAANLVWVGRQCSADETRSWFDKLPDAKSAVGAEGRWMLIGGRFDVSAPFHVRDDIGPADGGRWLDVEFDVRRDDSDREYRQRRMEAAMMGAPDGPYLAGGTVLLGTGRGSRLFLADRTLIAPGGTKALKVSPRRDHGSAALGGPLEIHMDLLRKADPVKVAGQDGAYSINGGPALSASAAERALRGRGLSRDEARATLKEASASRGRDWHVAWVKRADPWNENRNGSVSGPGFLPAVRQSERTLTRALPAIPRQAWARTITSLEEPPGAWAAYDPRKVPRVVPEGGGAAWRGAVRGATPSDAPDEIFDTGLIAASLSTTQPDLQVDRHLRPLKAAMTALADVLLSSYWHAEDFADRYGKSDAASLEDMLRNAFLNLGKLVLILQKKAVESPLDLDSAYDAEIAADG